MEQLKKFFKNPRARNITILSFLIVVLSGYLIYMVLSQKEAPPGALRVVMCTKCDYKYILRVTNIKDSQYVCKKCGGKLGYAWKCNVCDYEYAYLPGGGAKFNLKDKKTSMDVFRFVVDKRKCPQCGSKSTVPITVEDFTHKKSKKRKKHRKKRK